jgi:hypothetical protein
MKCSVCGDDMNETDSCDPDRVIEHADGTTRPPIPYGEEASWETPRVDVEPPTGDDECHDCGVSAGAHHHPACDMENCPFCGGQYLSCGCPTNESSKRLIAKDWFDPDDPVGSLNRAKRGEDGRDRQ